MLEVVDHTLWATLGVLLGRNAAVYKEPHGEVHMNAPLWAYTYIL